ncbi:hypothetical protein NG829_03620 [Xanthomonas sacchari]|uniref:hypothetical protein n=1 Tax=Xanthomonas sacchari TaxID=56458 RepID=UPI00225DCEA3|nr:hypothetical protein [Xanthomonas sacchari]UYK81416.1 hypothetical protein NG829_03620 [Xanthomonas sacchari]
MTEVVVDTNVLLVAEGKHSDVSEECVLSCVARLQKIMREEVVVVDDDYRVIEEYHKKLDTKRGKGVGTVFLKWLLQRQSNANHVIRVSITEHAQDRYVEFPVAHIEEEFDPPDRKFPAVSNAHPSKPKILQASDCKWLRWWPDLQAAGVYVDFLCPDDVCRFYKKKFPGESTPALP